jgi:hypothetical protein
MNFRAEYEEREAPVKRLIGLVLVVVMLAVVPIASAQSEDPTVSAYGGVAGEIQDTLDQPATEETQTVGILPFTGLDLALAGGAGILLVGLGFGLRRASRTTA